MTADPTTPPPDLAPATQVVGVLGGIASGKSEVARLIAGRGGIVIDADRLAHDELASEPVRRWLAERVGPAAVGPGGVDRALVAGRSLAEVGESALGRAVATLARSVVAQAANSR